MRYTIALVAFLAATPVHADNLTCKRWLELGHHRYLGHGYAEPMAAAGGEIKGTMDTLNAIRAVIARQAQRPAPAVHNLQELWDAVMGACEHEPDKPVVPSLPRCEMQLSNCNLRLTGPMQNDARKYLKIPLYK